jgi:glutamyl-tRNA reductase
MGEGVATALSRAGVSEVVVVNRTSSRGEVLAEKVGARVSSFDNLAEELRNADVVVACTGAGGTVISRSMVDSVRTESSAPLLIVDIALPRDVEDSVADIGGVTLRDLDHLSEWAERGISEPAKLTKCATSSLTK